VISFRVSRSSVTRLSSALILLSSSELDCFSW
jgi:hypothetical protein